jgi:inhibitor of cysteine peptidase
MPTNINLKKGEEFLVTLDSTPTGGYRWYPSFNANVINLILHNFNQDSQKLIGGSGHDIFTFRAVDSGTTILKMIYKRDWEDIVISEKNYLIDVE